jgi:anti-sigma B factor antagonist
MSVPLHIAQRSTDGVVVLTLSGHLVFDEGDRAFREHVTSLVDAGTRLLLLDLEGLTYIDSGGVGALVEMYMLVMRRGGHLKLLHPSWCSTRVLQVTHLSSVFEIFDDEAKALRSMTGPSAGAALS